MVSICMGSPPGLAPGLGYGVGSGGLLLLRRRRGERQLDRVLDQRAQGAGQRGVGMEAGAEGHLHRTALGRLELELRQLDLVDHQRLTNVQARADLDGVAREVLIPIQGLDLREAQTDQVVALDQTLLLADLGLAEEHRAELLVEQVERGAVHRGFELDVAGGDVLFAVLLRAWVEAGDLGLVLGQIEHLGRPPGRGGWGQKGSGIGGGSLNSTPFSEPKASIRSHSSRTCRPDMREVGRPTAPRPPSMPAKVRGRASAAVMMSFQSSFVRRIAPGSSARST